MPKLLIVAATPAEIKPLMEHFNTPLPASEGVFPLVSNASVHILITGVGMVNTAFMLGKYLSDSYSLIINAGISGVFNRQINLGEVLRIHEDCLSEMGAENDTEFIRVDEMGFGCASVFYDNEQFLPEELKHLKRVRGITVNTVHGNETSITRTLSLFNPQTESMEGAAFLRACKGHKAAYVQIRAVSNYVEKRDKSKWNIPLAVTNLNQQLIMVVNAFLEKN